MTEQLETEFIKKGFSFRMVSKSDSAYLFEVNTGKSIHYEIFKIKESEILSDFENKIGSGNFKHRYTSDENFGVWAWSTTNTERASEIFNSL